MLKTLKSFFELLVALVFLFGFMGNSHAVIIDINSITNNESRPVSVFFDAGTYDVSAIGVSDGGAYNSWNAWNWGQVYGCNSEGANCTVGWINNYYISSLEFGELFLSDGIRYANSLLALANAVSTSFTLTSGAFVDFYIRDGVNGSLAWDNRGGISLNANLPTKAPEPLSLFLIIIGLIGMVGIKNA